MDSRETAETIDIGESRPGKRFATIGGRHYFVHARLMRKPTLDLRGLKCPLPALFARRALARADKGDAFELLCDDPMARVDVPHMCHTEGYEVIEATMKSGLIRFVLRRPD